MRLSVRTIVDTQIGKWWRAHVLANVRYQLTVALTANDFFARRACDFLGHHNLLSSGSP